LLAVSREELTAVARPLALYGLPSLRDCGLAIAAGYRVLPGSHYAIRGAPRTGCSLPHLLTGTSD